MEGRSRKNLCCLLLLLWQLLLVANLHPCRGTEEEVVSAPMVKEEKEALFAAIQGFVGKWWNGSDLYPDPCGWTPIQGVSCDVFNGYWYTTSLHIGPVMENSLQCSSNPRFTIHLFQLTHLRTLSIFNCFLHSHIRIPSTNWAIFSNTLETLEFRSNPALIGSIPSSLSTLKSLKSLILIENGLQGNIPSAIGKLVKLKQLVLSSNRLSAQIPETLGGLPNLLILDASRNSIVGSIPNTFGSFTSLLKLDLSYNQIESNLPREIGNLKNLTLLDLRNNKLSGGLVPELESMVSLKELSLSGNPIIGGEMTVIQWRRMQSLEVLDLSNTGLNGDVPATVAEMKRLRFLGLSDNFLSGKVSPKLVEMENLGAMYLQMNNFSGVLEFPMRFYGRMGRRFGAWGNRNLCYLEESMSPEDEAAVAGRNSIRRRPPYGVKRCRL